MWMQGFQYPKLLQYFEEISAIPRPSYHEERIAEYLCAFAQERGLSFVRDEANNVLIDLPATEGYEDRPCVLLQGHTDMVCEKNADVEHDFLRDGLDLYVEDGCLRARGTTLGADDGVAVAMMLCLLDSPSLPHPRCQCLFTASEEVGLDGARSFDYSHIDARYLINMDSADEDCVTVGCAGGVRTDLILSPTFEENDAPCYTISVGGLLGGHSGENIADGRTNANKLMGRILLGLSRKASFRLISFCGGNKDNAIPREAVAEIATEEGEAVSSYLLTLQEKLREEMSEEDSGFFLGFAEAERSFSAITAEDTQRLITLVDTVPNGVLAMSHRIAGLVAFSRNLGVVRSEGERVILKFSSRSANEEVLDASERSLEALGTAFSAEVAHHNRYPGWDFPGNSPLLCQYQESFASVYGKEARVIALHAGLECGIIRKALPHMDMLSCGPNERNIHSPDESLELDSLERFARVIFGLLKNIR